MSFWFTLTRVATVLNIALLLGLTGVWVRNYLRVRTRMGVGLVAFGGLMLAENAFALYLYVVDPTTSGWFAEIPVLYNRALMVLAVLQFAAFAALAWVTMETPRI